MSDDSEAPEVPVEVPEKPAKKPMPPNAVPQPHGGWLTPRQKGDPPLSDHQRRLVHPTWTRKAVRKRLTEMVGEEGLPQLKEWINGRAKVLVGFRNHSELAERFHELYERAMDKDADMVTAWIDVPDERKSMLIDIFRELTGGQVSMRTIAMNVGVVGQQAAVQMALQFGLGQQTGLVDDEGNTMPGVVVMPELEMHQMTQAHRAKLLVAGEDEPAEDAEFEYVIEEVNATVDARPGEAEAPPPVEERVNPAVVEIIKMRRNRREDGE